MEWREGVREGVKFGDGGLVSVDVEERPPCVRKLNGQSSPRE